jgi:hypothetical protein
VEVNGQLCALATFLLREGCTISNWIGGRVVFGTSMDVGAKSHRLYIQVHRFGQQLLNQPVVFFWGSDPCSD